MHGVLPRVFSGRNDMKSEIWNREVTMERGRSYLVSAESGTGKSSLCSYLYGFRNDYSGRITFSNTDIATLNIMQWCELRSRHIAYLPQEMRLFPELTAMENVELKNRLTRFHSTDSIKQMFDRLGIADKSDQPVAQLSIARRAGEPPRRDQQPPCCRTCDRRSQAARGGNHSHFGGKQRNDNC